MSNAKKESESHYETIGGEENYEFLPTGFEDKRNRRMELFRNGGKFPDNSQPVGKFVEENKEARPRVHSFKLWKGKCKESKKKNKDDLNNKTGTCHFPPNESEIQYEVFGTLPKPINKPKFIPKSPLKPDPKYKEQIQVSLFQDAPIPVDSNDTKVNEKSLKPQVMPPIRRVISHRAVHSHKYPILAPIYQDITPEPPKRVQSLEVKKVRKQQLPPFVQPKKEINDKPNCEEIYPSDIIPSFEVKKPKLPKLRTNSEPVETTPLITTNDIRNDKDTSLKTLWRSVSPPSGVKSQLTTVQTNNNQMEQSNSTRRPPPVPIKPKRSKDGTEIPKEVHNENIEGETKEITMQNLESHLKQFNIINAIDSNSQFRKLNYYQESPSKVAGGLKQITS